MIIIIIVIAIVREIRIVIIFRVSKAVFFVAAIVKICFKRIFFVIFIAEFSPRQILAA